MYVHCKLYCLRWIHFHISINVHFDPNSVLPHTQLLLPPVTFVSTKTSISISCHIWFYTSIENTNIINSRKHVIFCISEIDVSHLIWLFPTVLIFLKRPLLFYVGVRVHCVYIPPFPLKIIDNQFSVWSQSLAAWERQWWESMLWVNAGSHTWEMKTSVQTTSLTNHPVQIWH